jgi:beta-lactam-binding protein with PASTA domain/predicted Ser/Thr protein kinase
MADVSASRPSIINDRYQLVKRIGRGGMADVFLGNDRLLDRQVAIKTLFPEFAVDPNFVERFRREAQAAANLSHPNIVTVFDWGRHGTTYFIAMEYVDGRTLADILRSNGHLTSKQAAEIASEVAAALGFAHAAGLVHRDIKPANILIGTNGTVKVADFGIARALNAPSEANLTQAGAVMGTATYFSPEQAQGAQPDPRSDLYSLGIVMYEMIAGRPPFTGDNPVSIAYRQVHDYPTPLNQLVADVPRPFEAIVAKLLSKDPAVRYSTADALREDLRRFRTGERPVALQSAAIAHGRTGQTTAVVPGRADPQARVRTVAQRPVPAGRGGSGPPSGQQPTGVTIPARYREQSRTGWYALAAFFALVALGIGGFLLFNTLANDDPPSSRQLPDYVGQQLSTVVADLSDRDLTYTVIEEQNDNFDDGIVHRTDPAGGTVMPEGGRVQLFVNPTNDTAVVPDVAGMTVDEARQALEAVGFRVIDTVTEQNDDVTEGRVVRTEPEDGAEVGVQETITLFVAGPSVAATDDGIEVPYVIESSEAEARQLITDAGLEVEVNYIDRPFGDRFDDTVMDQSPRVGDRLQRGATVTINVGRAADAPPQTNPPQTNPPQTNPPQTNPPQTNPPQTNPPQTNPPQTNPPATTPPPPTTTQPATTTTGP